MFEPDTKEAVQMAATFCEGLKQAGNMMVPAYIQELRRQGEDVDEQEAMEKASAFKFRVMKINVAQ